MPIATRGRKPTRKTTAAQRRTVAQKAAPQPIADDSDERLVVEPRNDDQAQLANEIADLLRRPIVSGGIEDDEPDEDTRQAYQQQSYANDPVHEEWFDPTIRSAGPLHLPIDKLDIDGQEYALCWVPCRMGSGVHTGSMQRATMAGWSPVPMDRLPSSCRSFAFKSDFGDNFCIRQDVILMMRPMALQKRWEAREKRAADDKMRRVEQFSADLARMPGMQGINGLAKPTRTVHTGRHATAEIQDALEQFSQSSERAPVSGHAVRGFGPHR